MIFGTNYCFYNIFLLNKNYYFILNKIFALFINLFYNYYNLIIP